MSKQQSDDFNPGNVADELAKSLVSEPQTFRESMMRNLAMTPPAYRAWVSFLYHAALAFLRMFTLSVEVFLHRQFGERYLTLTGIVLGGFTFQFVAWMWNFKPSTLIPLMSFGMWMSPTPSKPVAVFDLVGFCIVVYYLVAGWHLIAIFVRNREGKMWYSRSSGLSFPFLTWINTLGKRFNFHQDLVKMYVEPAMCYGVGWFLTKSMGPNFPATWLTIAGIALFLKSQIEYGERKKALLDQLDAIIEAREVAEMLAGKRQDAPDQGLTVSAAVPVGEQRQSLDDIFASTDPALAKLMDKKP
jgi:hypothetical protein